MHAAPFVDRAAGVVARRISLCASAEEKGERFARWLAPDAARDERAEIIGRARRAVLGSLFEERQRAGNVDGYPLSLDERDGEVERAVGAAALRRLSIEGIGRLQSFGA